MNNGYVKFHRKSTESSVWKNPIIWMVWSWCLFRANHQINKFPFNGKDIEIKRGQFITGIQKAIKEIPITAQNYRTAIDYLKSTSRITTQSTNKFTIISIVKYEEYQRETNNLTSKLTGKLTNHQQTTNKPLTTNKNDKNEKNDKKILIPAHEEVKKILKRYIPIRDIDNKTNLSYLVRLYNALDKDTTKVEALCKAVEHFSKSEYPYSIYSIRALYEKLDKIRARVAQEQLKLNNKKPTWITL